MIMLNYSVVYINKLTPMLSQFHTSASLNSKKDQDLVKRLQDLKDFETNNSNSYSSGNTDPTLIDIKKGLLELNNEISNIKEEEFLRDIRYAEEFIDKNKDTMSNFEEAFPNYAAEYTVKKIM